jgi:hypothetical protein
MIHWTPLGLLIVTWHGLLWIALLFIICGLAGALMVPFVARAMDNTKRAKAERAAAMPEAAQRKIDEMYRLLAESGARETALSKENASFRRLARERIAFDKYNDSRSHATMQGRST